MAEEVSPAARRRAVAGGGGIGGRPAHGWAPVPAAWCAYARETAAISKETARETVARRP